MYTKLNQSSVDFWGKSGDKKNIFRSASHRDDNVIWMYIQGIILSVSMTDIFFLIYLMRDSSLYFIIHHFVFIISEISLSFPKEWKIALKCIHTCDYKTLLNQGYK